jgi:hypothetical protein
LHADAEHERAHEDRCAHRGDEPLYRLAEQTAVGEHGKEQRAGDRQHQHLCPQSGTAPVRDQDAKGGGETEGRVIERQTQRPADQEQGGLGGTDGARQPQRAKPEQRRGDHGRTIVPAGVRTARGKQAAGRVGDGKISHPGPLYAFSSVN